MMKTIKLLSIATVSIMLTVLLVSVVSVSADVPPDGQAIQTATFPVADGYLLRFDTTISQFNVITMPIVTGKSRRPESVVAVGGDIWYTDPGTDRIGRLVYTDATHYAFSEVQLPTGSAPFDMVADGGYLWFTAKSGDWVGRLEISTTAVVSFPLTAGSAPWRIDVSADGGVWFTERAANKLGHLVVTDTTHYALTEYNIPESDSQPEGIAVGGTKVWFGETVPAGDTKVIEFNTLQLPPDDFKTISSIPGNGYPANLMYDGTDLWATELLGNNLSWVKTSTLGSIFQYPVPTAAAQPYNLVSGGENIWFTERTGQKMGRFFIAHGQFFEYSIPLTPSVWLTGIVMDGMGNVWAAGFEIQQVFLPLVLR